MNIPVLRIIRDLAKEICNDFPANPLINLHITLKKRLEREGCNSLSADELASLWVDRLLEEISIRMKEWIDLGLPRPLIEINSPHTLMTCLHARYMDEVEGEGIRSDFGKISELISSMSPIDFLAIPILLLDQLECEVIIITDATNDGGIDCIGKLSKSPLRSLCIFIQAKTSIRLVGKGVLLQEKSKFQEIQGKSLIQDYFEALGIKSSRDGRGLCYMIISNNEFEDSARIYAYENNIILRSNRQISHWISENMSFQQFHDLVIHLRPYLSRDLSRNLKQVLHKSLR